MPFLGQGQNVNETFENEISQAFGDLDKSKVPHGLLLDFAMEFTDVEAFNGQLTGSNFVDLTTYTNLYHTMLMSRVRNVTQGFMLPQDFADTWAGYRRDNNLYSTEIGIIPPHLKPPTIVLSGMYYEYSKIKETALTQGDIAVSNNQYQDVFQNGQWQNPYEELQVFAMASPVYEIKGNAIEFLLPEELWLTNQSQRVSKIEVEVGSGYYEQLGFGQKVFFNFQNIPAQEGVHNITFKLTLDNGQILESQIKIKTNQYSNNTIQIKSAQSTGMQVQGADSTFMLKSEEAHDGKFARGIVSINYAAGRNEIRKPLIVAEGFDPGIITSPENPYGLMDIEDFINSIKFINSNLRNLLVVDDTQEYDIIYVDWLNGVDDMRRNAELLETVIQWVNTQKADNGSPEKNVVLGQSMGGVIARYALREMELENVDHETRLYISHDAPHQGAYVPYGLQFMARHARNEYVQAPTLFGLAELWIPLAINVADWYSQNVYSNIDINIDPSPYAVLSLADMPASRQLLTNFVKSDYSVDNTVHDNWQNELNNRGYPQEYGIKNVAISNGSECGITQEFNPGAYLFRFYGESSPAFLNSLLRVITDPLAGLLLNNAELLFTGILPGSSEYNYDIWAKTIPTGSSQQVYKGRIVYTKKLLFLFPIDVVLMNKNLDAPPGSLPIDTYPGGYYDVEANIDIDALPSFLSDRITHIENFNFIPVTSSLDIGLGELNLDEEDYLRSYSGGNPPLAPTNSPFDNFITAFSTNSNINPNEQHISFQIRNANWLAQELEGESANIADCSFTCQPLRIEGLSSLCSSGEYFIETAADVQWSASPSNLVNIFNNGSSNVTITPSSSSSKGSVTLTATIDSPDCGSRTWTKSIEVGKPQIDIPGLSDPSHSWVSVLPNLLL